jgi:beta-glucosidase
MKERTYRYFSDKPLYGFGFGLSYTNFTYSGIKLPSSSIKAGDPITVEADVKNTGSAAGDEVVELYLTQPKSFETPIRVLAGFTRVHLAPGKSTHLGLTIDPRSIAQVDSNGARVILPGDYTVSVGGTQPGGPTPVQTANFTITGKAELAK